MSKVMINDLVNFIGNKVKVSGWLYSRTSKGKLIFLMIRDGSALVQAIVSRQTLSEEHFNLADKLTQESSLEIIGVVREDNRAIGGYEIEVESLKIFQICDSYPISPKEHGVEFLMFNQHLWIRSQHISSVLKIRAEIISAARDFLNSQGFYQVDTPILTPSACEGTSTLFKIDYFGEPAYLTQSGQLYNEATCMALRKVYTFGPTFRAEKSRTRRHLMEFWMLEPEMAFVEQEENMTVQEELIYYIVSSVLRNCSNELATLKRDVSFLKKVQTPFPRLTYSRAVEILREKGFDIEWGDDFGAPQETAISSLYEKPVFITHYPASIKAFYMQPDVNKPELVLCADLIASEGYGEIIGGSQRIHDYDLLKKKINEHNLPMEAYLWYLDLRKYGSVPHSGFGLGLERTVCWICGLSHIRETIAFPRMLDKIYP